MEEETCSPPLANHPAMHEPPKPSAMRDPTLGSVRQGEAVPPQARFALEPAPKGQHDVGVRLLLGLHLDVGVEEVGVDHLVAHARVEGGVLLLAASRLHLENIQLVE